LGISRSIPSLQRRTRVCESCLADQLRIDSIDSGSEMPGVGICFSFPMYDLPCLQPHYQWSDLRSCRPTWIVNLDRVTIADQADLRSRSTRGARMNLIVPSSAIGNSSNIGLSSLNWSVRLSVVIAFVISER
jgi:hypothetical protein